MNIEEIKKDFYESAYRIADATDVPNILKDKFVTFAWICAIGSASKKEDLDKFITEFKNNNNGK